MKKLSFLIWVILALATLKIGVKLREIKYGEIPEPYIILDEHTNVWHGLSLRSTGVPAAWSILDVYKKDSRDFGVGGRTDNFNVVVNDQKPTLLGFSKFPKPAIAVNEFDFGRGISQTQIVQPYLDHPPFGALVLSSLVPNRVNSFAKLSSYDMRYSAIMIALFTQFLIFIFAWQITKKPIIGVIASLIYATAPSFLLMSRYSMLENVLNPLILISLIIISYSNENRNKKYLLMMAGIIGGLMALTKLTGWVFVIGIAIVLYFWKYRFNEILIYLLTASLIGCFYFIWGFYLSPKLFSDLLLFQTGRGFIGSINFMVTLFKVNIYNFPVDGWWIGGFTTLFLIPNEKKYFSIKVLTLAGLFSALCVSGANYPWYFITIIPFMVISIALFIYNLAMKPNLKKMVMFFLIFFSSSFYWGYGVYQSFQPFMIYRILFVLFLLIPFLAPIYSSNLKFNKMWKVFFAILLVIVFVLNYRSIFFISDNWGKLPLIYTPGTF